MIAPIAWRVPPRHYGPWELVVSRLTEGLVARGVDVTCETCPHYLTLSAEDVADGRTEFKCCPPVRESANADRLWAGLAEGLIDLVVSDHSPCPADLKRLDVGDFGLAWGGISSVQLGLPVVWTDARRRGHQWAVDLCGGGRRGHHRRHRPAHQRFPAGDGR